MRLWPRRRVEEPVVEPVRIPENESDHDKLFRLLLPDPPNMDGTSCCGSILVQRYKYDSVVCKCRITCLLPGPMPDDVSELLGNLNPDENQALLVELTNALPANLREIHDKLERERVVLPWEQQEGS